MAQAIPLALMAGSTLLSAGGTIAGANAQAGQLRSEATQLDAMAGTDRASSQRTAAEQKRQARIIQSRALAVAAASGGGASDPTVINILSRLEGEGEYRSLVALYEGEESARSKEAQAIARRKEAKNVKRAGYISAASTVLSGASTMYSRFGGGGAPATSGRSPPPTHGQPGHESRHGY